MTEWGVHVAVLVHALRGVTGYVHEAAHAYTAGGAGSWGCAPLPHASPVGNYAAGGLVWEDVCGGCVARPLPCSAPRERA